MARNAVAAASAVDVDIQSGKPECPLEKNSSAVEFKFEKNGYRIFENKNTGLLFVAPTPSQEELNHIYSESYFSRGRKYTPPAGDRTTDPQLFNDRKKLELVQSYNAGKRLLDVGSAMGGFMRVAADAGFAVEGVEVSQFGADYTRNELGLPVHACSLREAALPSSSFDVVTMWDVIEHLPDPLENLAEVNRVLRPGGLCFITTGDVSSRYARTLGKRWHLLTPPQHLFYFTPRALEGALAAHGMKAIGTSWAGKHASLDFVLFKAGETLGSVVSPIRLLAQKLGLAGLRLYINLGDIMTVVACKGDQVGEG
jgi:SAM-dependent methyltransferase